MKTIVLWAIFVLLAIPLIVWNERLTKRNSEQSRACAILEQDYALAVEDSNKFRELESKRKAAMQTLSENEKQAIEMMSVCKSPDDFIPVYPEQIHVFLLQADKVQFYVPPGEHQLRIRHKFFGQDTWLNLGFDNLDETWKTAKETLVKLDGANAYQLRLQTDDEQAEIFEKFSKVQIKLSGTEITTIPNPTEGAVVGSLSSVGMKNRFALPNEIQRPFNDAANRPVAGFTLMTRGVGLKIPSEDGSHGTIGIEISIQSSGKRRILPTNQNLCNVLFSSTSLDPLEFNSDKGWYELKDSELEVEN